MTLKHCSVVVLEYLSKLRDNAKKGREFNKKLALWFYRGAELCIEYETKERGLGAVKVNPRGTSSECLKCSSKLVDNGYSTLRCSKCGFIGDRET